MAPSMMAEHAAMVREIDVLTTERDALAHEVATYAGMRADMVQLRRTATEQVSRYELITRRQQDAGDLQWAEWGARLAVWREVAELLAQIEVPE